MMMESEVSLAPEAQVTDVIPENVPTESGDPGLTLSLLNNAATDKPVKRPTRQWAAWTRQEEESFFTALRQVGKNFEKITSRVQSKNKDQVRHYYYRLVRRMNKLLGPGLCLDAKNSKDTNAAMLRWWSLLEKNSCRASKLHLKPRKFKTFVEALEQQLKKDQKKNVRKRPSQDENSLPTSPNGNSNQGRSSGNVARPVKVVLIDSRNVPKLGPGRSSFKRNANIGVNRSNNKGDSSTMKPPRQRRKPGAPSAAYRKWEKAAIAGVSLVADAAEHLERAIYDKEIVDDQDKSGQKGLDQVENILPPVPNFSQSLFVDNNMHAITGKLKLQLFPIDESTRRALETDKHNPHLELTLSTRKKISSVLEHLNRKWGNSSIASGEIMLFPFSVQRENFMASPRWTQASVVNAAEVYAMIGSPPTFRLRYGWLSNAELVSSTWKAPVIETPTLDPSSLPGEMDMHLGTSPISNTRNSSLFHRFGTENSDAMRQFGEADDQRLSNSNILSAGEWADSLTNISIGDLLSEAPDGIEVNCTDPPVAEGSQALHQIPFTCDSFDAAIAAHISKHQERIGGPSVVESHASSIFDAEETCDAFSFRKNLTRPEVGKLSPLASPGSSKQIPRTNVVSSSNLREDLPNKEERIESSAREDTSNETPHILDDSAKDFTSLTDMYWPDSLGPLFLDTPPSKYHNEDLILGDSLGGLNRLIASSLDAFQNCSFFGLDKKDSKSAPEAQETAS